MKSSEFLLHRKTLTSLVDSWEATLMFVFSRWSPGLENHVTEHRRNTMVSTGSARNR